MVLHRHDGNSKRNAINGYQYHTRRGTISVLCIRWFSCFLSFFLSFVLHLFADFRDKIKAQSSWYRNNLMIITQYIGCICLTVYHNENLIVSFSFLLFTFCKNKRNKEIAMKEKRKKDEIKRRKRKIKKEMTNKVT